ncbi:MULTISPECIES: CAP domain-containing protein [unclassified Burkholderia]|uniref:CAP domain-containing protein n=1 Tax=unclassified Burkholderia TaxID=2613784 RepID=UPI002AAF433A|nr:MULTISPECIES: CAP domain-containing protein [unclassified Burkholderia]
MQNQNAKQSRWLLALAAAAAAIALAACGGGGDGSASTSSSSGSTTPSAGAPTGASSTTPTTPTTVTGTLPSPQYANTSAQLASLNLLNQYRTQCGFPALQENTVLDTAAQNHAKYEGLNGALSDDEVAGSAGFTGVTYLDRAVAVGFPSSAKGWGVGAGFATLTSGFTPAQAGQQFVYSLIAGVYHSGAVMYPVNTVGIGEFETQTNSNGTAFTNAWGSMSLLSTQTQPISNGPITFPCQGVSGVPYKSVGETPTAPNVSGSGWGTPVVVMGNPTDAIVLQSGTMTDGSGNVINLQLLTSANDTNKIVQPYEAVAYPAAALLPNTQYAVSLTGTVNGVAFSRSFTFTTGNIVG